MDEEKVNELSENEDKLDPLQEAIQAEVKKVQMAGLLSGAKAICGVILNYITEYNRTPGKHTFRQQEKLIKKIRVFCEISLARKIDENGEIVPIKKEEITENKTSE